MGKLTIQEIAKVLVTKNGLQQSEANRFAVELFALIQERLEKNDQVKVKGLGTWKVITVEARESVSVRTGSRVLIDEHLKITFTPDAVMKELVNKPFSQFETVVLNDNVEFDDLKEQPADTEFEDIKDDLTEEELAELEQLEQSEHLEEPAPVAEPVPVVEPVPEVEEPVHFVEEPVVEAEEPVAVDEPVIEESAIEIEDHKVEEPVATLKETPEDVPEEVPVETPEETPEPVAYDDEEASHSWSKWLWIALGAICIACLSAVGGYYYGRQHTALAALTDTVYVCDTVYVPETQDTISIETPVEPAAEQEVVKVETPKTEEPKVEKPKAETVKVVEPKSEPAPEIDKYAQKDERVRLGAYRIVGLDHEVTVLQGQTFYSICRAHLGPDMECYIEVYNDLPRNPQIKAGQVIKIPKLQLKKRKKQ